MELLDERSQVRGVAKRWRAQYGEGTYGGDQRECKACGCWIAYRSRA